jgi:hypothetical protein
MSEPTTTDEKAVLVQDTFYETLDEIARAGARKMLIAALEAEVEVYIQRHQNERDKAGHALVVRNGRSRERTVQCGAGSLKGV